MENLLKHIVELPFKPSRHQGTLKKVIFSDVELSSKVTQVAYTELEYGCIIEAHAHESLEEIFLVMEGTCEVLVNDMNYILTKDSIIKIPPKATHSFTALEKCRIFFIGIAV